MRIIGHSNSAAEYRCFERFGLIHCVVIVVLTFVMGCHGSTTSDGRTETTRVKQVASDDQTRAGNSGMKQDLLQLVRDFATSDAQRRKDAWKVLSSYPRPDLIKMLLRLRDDAKVDTDRLAIAFLLCNLDVDYEPNKESIVSAMLQKPHVGNPYSDWEAELIGRLVRRGDKNLLPALFGVSEWSDGGLSEELSSIFEEELKSNPQVFLLKIKTVPKNIREKVYDLFDEDTLTLDEISKIKVYLQSVSSESSVGLPSTKSTEVQVAKELSAKLSQVESRLKKEKP